MRKISSPQGVASVSNLCNSRSQGAGNMGNRECCSGLGKRVCPFISRKSSMDFLEIWMLDFLEIREPTGSLELHGRRRSRKDPKYPRKILVGRNAGAEKRRVRADWESARKRAD